MGVTIPQVSLFPESHLQWVLCGLVRWSWPGIHYVPRLVLKARQFSCFYLLRTGTARMLSPSKLHGTLFCHYHRSYLASCLEMSGEVTTGPLVPLSYLGNMYNGQTMRGHYEARPGIWSHGYTVSHMAKVDEIKLPGVLWFTPWCARGGRQLCGLAVPTCAN